MSSAQNPTENHNRTEILNQQQLGELDLAMRNFWKFIVTSGLVAPGIAFSGEYSWALPLVAVFFGVGIGRFGLRSFDHYRQHRRTQHEYLQALKEPPESHITPR